MDRIITAGTEAAALVPELWSAKLYQVLRANYPLIGAINRDYEGEIKALGDTVNISSIPLFSESAENIAENQAVDAEAVTAANIQLIINKQTVKDFMITDRAKVQSLAFTDDVRDKAAFAILHSMNAELLAGIVASTSAPDHYIPFDAGSTLGKADALESKELLDIALVPQEDRFMLIGPRQVNDLLALAEVLSKDYNGDLVPFVSGQIPSKIYGFTPLYMADLGNVVHFFHSSFMTMAIQKEMEVKEFDMGATGARASRVNSSILWGYKLMDNDRVVTLY